MIDQLVGKPIPALLEVKTRTRKTVALSIYTKIRGQGGTMFFMLGYLSDGKPAKMSAVRVGCDTRWNAEGSCKVLAG